MDLLKKGVTEFDWEKMSRLIETKSLCPGSVARCLTWWQGLAKVVSYR